MDKENTFKDFLSSQVPQMSLLDFSVNLTLAMILGYCLKKVFEKFSHVQGNKAMVGNNLVLVCMTTMLIISVVKSSLALSLGLVGALSIVRFRAAIKEPEELAYLFIAISMGLGLGADQKSITLVGFSVLTGAIVLLSYRRLGSGPVKLFHIVLFQEKGALFSLEQMRKVLGKHGGSFEVKRWEIYNGGQELSSTIVVKQTGLETLMQEMQEMKKQFPDLQIKVFEPLDIG